MKKVSSWKSGLDERYSILWPRGELTTHPPEERRGEDGDSPGSGSNSDTTFLEKQAERTITGT